MGLPGGTVTLLFTDIEGSTRLLDELGPAYSEALAEHRRRVRAAVSAHGGVEVDTQGDAFLCAFQSARNAVFAATAAQTALAGTPVRVRIGVHTGEPALTDEGYVALDVHRGARSGRKPAPRWTPRSGLACWTNGSRRRANRCRRMKRRTPGKRVVSCRSSAQWRKRWSPRPRVRTSGLLLASRGGRSGSRR